MTRPHSNHPAVTLSVRVSPKVRDKLEKMADATGRSKSFLASEAIESYLIVHGWQVESTEKALKKANSKKAKFINHSEVAVWLNTWGTKKEQEPPK